MLISWESFHKDKSYNPNKHLSVHRVYPSVPSDASILSVYSVRPYCPSIPSFHPILPSCPSIPSVYSVRQFCRSVLWLYTVHPSSPPIWSAHPVRLPFKSLPSAFLSLPSIPSFRLSILSFYPVRSSRPSILYVHLVCPFCPPVLSPPSILFVPPVRLASIELLGQLKTCWKWLQDVWTVVAVVANTKFGKTKLEDVSRKIKTLKWPGGVDCNGSVWTF